MERRGELVEAIVAGRGVRLGRVCGSEGVRGVVAIKRVRRGTRLAARFVLNRGNALARAVDLARQLVRVGEARLVERIDDRSVPAGGARARARLLMRDVAREVRLVRVSADEIHRAVMAVRHRVGVCLADRLKHRQDQEARQSAEAREVCLAQPGPETPAGPTLGAHVESRRTRASPRRARAVKCPSERSGTSNYLFLPPALKHQCQSVRPSSDVLLNIRKG